MGVTMTEKAAKHVANYLAKRGKGVGLRLGVRTSGCSGMAYKLEFVDEVSRGYGFREQRRQGVGRPEKPALS